MKGVQETGNAGMTKNNAYSFVWKESENDAPKGTRPGKKQ